MTIHISTLMVTIGRKVSKSIYLFSVNSTCTWFLITLDALLPTRHSTNLRTRLVKAIYLGREAVVVKGELQKLGIGYIQVISIL